MKKGPRGKLSRGDSLKRLQGDFPWKANRDRTLSHLKDGVVILKGGESEVRYQTDTDIRFRQESNFMYFSGIAEADCFLAIDICTRTCHGFFPKLPAEYAVWLGKIDTLVEKNNKYMIDEAHFVDDLWTVVAGLKPTVVHVLDAGLMPEKHDYKVDTTSLRKWIVESRVIKSREEIALIRKSVEINDKAFVNAIKNTKAGMREYQVENLITSVHKDNGAAFQSFVTIAAAGRSASTLHYMNNTNIIRAGETMLVDAGAEVQCYASDCTRTFAINGEWSEELRAIYSIVLEANKAVIAAVKPGIDWTDMHLLSEKVICRGLKKLCILVGDESDLLEARVANIFYPHGLGHFMGLDVHDVGGYPEGVKKIDLDGIRSLRCRRVMEPGMVITVEPGLYFIDALIEPALANPEKAKFLNKEAIYKHYPVGGIRIEDDLVITVVGNEVLTTAPKEIDELIELWN